jgi:ankyrin repeat protein
MEKRKSKVREAFAKAKRILFHKPKPEKPKLSEKEQEMLNDSLISAALHGNNEKIMRLIKKGADITAKGNGGATALHWVANREYSQTCALLIQEYAKSGGDIQKLISAKDDLGRAALCEAAQMGHTQICVMLIQEYAEAGGDIQKLISAKDDRGNTAMDFSSVKTAQFLKSMPLLQDLTGKEMFILFLASFADCTA